MTLSRFILFSLLASRLFSCYVSYLYQICVFIVAIQLQLSSGVAEQSWRSHAWNCSNAVNEVNHLLHFWERALSQSSRLSFDLQPHTCCQSDAVASLRILFHLDCQSNTAVGPAAQDCSNHFLAPTRILPSCHIYTALQLASFLRFPPPPPPPLLTQADTHLLVNSSSCCTPLFLLLSSHPSTAIFPNTLHRLRMLVKSSPSPVTSSFAIFLKQWYELTTFSNVAPPPRALFSCLAISQHLYPNESIQYSLPYPNSQTGPLALNSVHFLDLLADSLLLANLTFRARMQSTTTWSASLVSPLVATSSFLLSGPSCVSAVGLLWDLPQKFRKNDWNIYF
ncbi:putative signal peptide protein [Puccinia sorghi]|uniref:Putative signal peptide protein n=1 Tax=Puccinia sorghi TaxID=27349 RepID=A0A0L6VK24_9BASI|nr:putative signal peptide protein [Puccinia sorghi]